MPITALAATALKATLSAEVDKVVAPTESGPLKAAISAEVGKLIVVSGPAPAMLRLPLDLTRVHTLRASPGRYTREQKALVFKTSAISLSVHCTDMASSGAAVVLPYAVYTLDIDSVTHAIAKTAPLAKTATLTGAFAQEPDGLVLVELYGWVGNVRTLLMRYGAYLNRDGLCRNAASLWSQSGSFAWAKGNPSNDVARISKADFAPAPRPLPLREAFKPMPTALGATKINRRQLIPGAFENDHDPHYPCVTLDGITVSENTQGYSIDGLFEKHSRRPIVMGPRGVCTLPYVLNLSHRRNNKTIACGNGYIAEVDSTGAAILLAGHSHREAVYHEEPPTSVLDSRYIRRGKWDASIPVESQIFHEPWGGGWVARSLLVDLNAPPERWVDGEPPHLSYIAADGRLVNGPLWVQTDFNGGVWGVQFDGGDRSAEPYIYPFLPAGTLSDGWGLVTHENSMYITERTGQRISEWNLDTRQKVRNVLSAPAASVEGSIAPLPRRRFARTVGRTADTARSHLICFPEGLAKYIDNIGDVWLYYGSTAQECVSRVNVRTGAGDLDLCRPTFNYGGVGSFLCTVSVSDGTFGPAGTMFTSTYYNSGYGKPQAFLPGGKAWSYFNYIGGASNYPICAAVGGNRLTCADAGGMVDQFHVAEAVDPVLNGPLIKAGFEYWVRNGYSVIFGPNGCNKGSIELPWGKDAACDAYMRDLLGFEERT